MTRPIGRPIVQSLFVLAPHIDSGSRPISPGKDGASAPSSYITARRLDRIAADLTERDAACLAFVASSRLSTSKQLVHRFWTDAPQSHPAIARAARRALKRLADWRVLDPLPDRARGGVRGGSDTLVYGVGVAGVKLLARRGLRLRRLGAPGDRFIAHTLACTQVVVDLHVANAAGELELIEVQQEPASHRAFLGAYGTRHWVKPDLFARIGAGALEDRWSIEVDLATEHTGTLLTKSNRYLAHAQSGDEQREHGIYPRVLWAVPDDRRAGQLKTVLGKLPTSAEGMFSICRLDELAAFLAGEARS
jgi:hypothetical protein